MILTGRCRWEERLTRNSLLAGPVLQHVRAAMPPREQTTAIMGWTKDEDEALLKAVAVHGCKAWSAISCALPGRTGKACRERWFNHLNPRLRPEEWTPAEDATLFCTDCSLL